MNRPTKRESRCVDENDATIIFIFFYTVLFDNTGIQRSDINLAVVGEFLCLNLITVSYDIIVGQFHTPSGDFIQSIGKGNIFLFFQTSTQSLRIRSLSSMHRVMISKLLPVTSDLI